jgi:hypothetical protein
LILSERKLWSQALQAARQLIHAAPERVSGWLHQSYALRRAPEGGLSKAWETLLPLADKFPKEAVIPYNLACYACQLGQLDAARLWLKRAFEISEPEPLKSQALEDDDLEPLWEEIRKL